MPTDWCENSIFLSGATRRQVNLTIERVVDMAAGAATVRFGGVTALGVGGSLARREPSVSKSGLRLVSDVDLIVVLDGDGDSAHVRGVEQQVDQLVTAAKVGVVGVPARGVRQVRSFFAADFHAAMQRPLHGMPPQDPRPPSISRRDRLELIVNQVSSTLLHPGSTAGPEGYLLRPDAGYHAVKLLLECLRAVLAGEQGCSYNAVFRDRREARSRFVLPACAVEDVIRRRELFAADPEGLPDAGAVVVRALAAIFDLAPDPAAVVRHLLGGLADRTDPLSVFQWSCLGLLFEACEPAEPLRRTIASALSSAWARVRSDELSAGGRAALRTLARLPIEVVIRGSEEVRSLLRCFRLDYYRLLGDHIFGVSPRTDYNELA